MVITGVLIVVVGALVVGEVAMVHSARVNSVIAVDISSDSVVFSFETIEIVVVSSIAVVSKGDSAAQRVNL